MVTHILFACLHAAGAQPELFKMGRGWFSVELNDRVTAGTRRLLRRQIGGLAMQIFPGDRAALEVNSQ